MAEGYIPLSEITGYGRDVLDVDDMQMFVEVIQKVDSYYLEYRTKQSEEKKAS